MAVLQPGMLISNEPGFYKVGAYGIRIENVVLVTLPAESDSFPDVAKAMTSALSGAKLHGVDEAITSKVSIEIVQLSIECLDASANCYAAVAKSLAVTVPKNI